MNSNDDDEEITEVPASSRNLRTQHPNNNNSRQSANGDDDDVEHTEVPSRSYHQPSYSPPTFQQQQQQQQDQPNATGSKLTNKYRSPFSSFVRPSQASSSSYLKSIGRNNHGANNTLLQRQQQMNTSAPAAAVASPSRRLALHSNRMVNNNNNTSQALVNNNNKHVSHQQQALVKNTSQEQSSSNTEQQQIILSGEQMALLSAQVASHLANGNNNNNYNNNSRHNPNASSQSSAQLSSIDFADNDNNNNNTSSENGISAMFAKSASPKSASTNKLLSSRSSSNNNNTGSKKLQQTNLFGDVVPSSKDQVDKKAGPVERLRDHLKSTNAGKGLLPDFDAILQKQNLSEVKIPGRWKEPSGSVLGFLREAASQKQKGRSGKEKISKNQATELHSGSREEFLFLKRLLLDVGMLDGISTDLSEIYGDLQTVIEYAKSLQTETESPILTYRVECDMINKVLTHFCRSSSSNTSYTSASGQSTAESFAKLLPFLLRAVLLPKIVVVDPILAGEKVASDGRASTQNFQLKCTSCNRALSTTNCNWKYRRLFGCNEASILVYKTYRCDSTNCRNNTTNNNNGNDDEEDDEDEEDEASEKEEKKTGSNNNSSSKNSNRQTNNNVDSADEDGEDDDDYFENVGGPKIDPSERFLDQKTQKEVNDRVSKNKFLDLTMNAAGDWFKSLLGIRFTSKYAVEDPVLDRLLQVVNSRSNVHEEATKISKSFGETHLKRAKTLLQLLHAWRSQLVNRLGVSEFEKIISVFSAGATALHQTDPTLLASTSHNNACRLLRSPMIPSPSYQFLRNSVLEPELFFLRHPLQRCMETLGDRETISFDSTYKVAKSTSNRQSSVSSVYLAVNKKSQVCSCVFVPSDHYSNLKSWLGQINENKTIKTVYTDKCCTDKNLLREVYGRDVKIRLDLFHFNHRWSFGLNPRYHQSHRFVIKALCDASKEEDIRNKHRFIIPQAAKLKDNIESALEDLKKNKECARVISTKRFQKTLKNNMKHVNCGCLSDPEGELMYVPHVSCDESKESSFRGTSWNERIHMMLNNKALSSCSQHPETSRNNLLLVFTDHNYDRSINYCSDVALKFINPRTLQEAKKAWTVLHGDSHLTAQQHGRHLSALESRFQQTPKANPFYTSYFATFEEHPKQSMFDAYLGVVASSGDIPRTTVQLPVLRWCHLTTYQDAVSDLFDAEYGKMVRGKICRFIEPYPLYHKASRLFPNLFSPKEINADEDATAEIGQNYYVTLQGLFEKDHPVQQDNWINELPENNRYYFSVAQEAVTISTMKGNFIDAASELFVEILSLVFEDQEQFIPPLLTSDEPYPPPGTPENWCEEISTVFLESTKKFSIEELDNIVAEFLQHASDLTTNVIVLLRTGTRIPSTHLCKSIAQKKRNPFSNPLANPTQTFEPHSEDLPVFVPRRNLFPSLPDAEVDDNLRGVILLHCHHTGRDYSLALLGWLPLDILHPPPNDGVHAFTDPSLQTENRNANFPRRGGQDENSVPTTVLTNKITRLAPLANHVPDLRHVSKLDLGNLALAWDSFVAAKNDKSNAGADKTIEGALSQFNITCNLPKSHNVLMDFVKKAHEKHHQNLTQQQQSRSYTLSRSERFKLTNTRNINDQNNTTHESADEALATDGAVASPKPISSLRSRTSKVETSQKNNDQDQAVAEDDEIEVTEVPTGPLQKTKPSPKPKPKQKSSKKKQLY